MTTHVCIKKPPIFSKENQQIALVGLCVYLYGAVFMEAAGVVLKLPGA